MVKTDVEAEIDSPDNDCYSDELVADKVATIKHVCALHA